jgi:hypothetical protein
MKFQSRKKGETLPNYDRNDTRTKEEKKSDAKKQSMQILYNRTSVI